MVLAAADAVDSDWGGGVDYACVKDINKDVTPIKSPNSKRQTPNAELKTISRTLSAMRCPFRLP